MQPCDEDKEKDDQFLFSFLQVMEHRWNETDRGKRNTRGKTCPSATLSATNPTLTDPGSNQSFFVIYIVVTLPRLLQLHSGRVEGVKGKLCVHKSDISDRQSFSWTMFVN